MYLCKLGQDPSTDSEDNALKQSYTVAGTDTDGILTKTNMSPLNWGWGDINIICVILKSILMTHLLISFFMEYNYLYNLTNKPTDQPQIEAVEVIDGS